ncbi:MAG: hypothetical protein ACSLE0_10945 [Chitinophagaceae bacterium]
MRLLKWTGIVAGILLIIACFSTWVVIRSKNIVVSGIDASGIMLGRPGYIHFLFAILFILLSLTQRIWAKRVNLVIAAMNFAWAIRNYFVISACSGGDCPEKQTAIYLLVLASLLMLVSSLFPDIKLKKNNPGQ